jgi:hypothetical protein
MWIMAVDNVEQTLEIQAAVLLVECDPLPRGCGAQIGEVCTSTSRNPLVAGKPLGRQIAHPGRKARAGLLEVELLDVIHRCRQTALPVDECDHCKRWAELASTRPQRIGRPVVAAFSGTCSHCSQPWAPGAPIVRVVGGTHTHVGCSTDPPDDTDSD